MTAPTEIGIQVKGGVVTLTGTVDSAVKAQAVAHGVAGVLDVANDLVVNLPTDTDIACAVRKALVCEALVPDELIRSTVTGGSVTLEGTVPYLTQRYDAEKAVGGGANHMEVWPVERVTSPLRGDHRA